MIRPSLLSSTAALTVGLLAHTVGLSETPASTAAKPAANPALSLLPPGGFKLFSVFYPGQVALQLRNMDYEGVEIQRGPAAYAVPYYLGATKGGGQTINALISSATAIGPNERFTVEEIVGGYLNFITAGGDYVSVPLPYGSDLTRTTQTVQTASADTTLFTVQQLDYYGDYTLQTYYGYDLDFPDDGGESTAAIGLASAQNPSGYDEISPQQCGDLGSGYKYAIQLPSPGGVGQYVGSFAYFTLGAVGGLAQDAFLLAEPGENSAQLTLLQQDDGSYALQTSNGINYLTAVNGGGLDETNGLLTNATQVQSWEKFRITDQGNCTYTIQTSSGYYLAWQLVEHDVDQDRVAENDYTYYQLNLTTRITYPQLAPTVGFNAYFVLRPLWH